MSILLTAVAVCVVLVLLLLFVRRTEAGLSCLLAVELFNLAFGSNAALVGHLHLNAMDVVSMVLLAAGAVRFVRNLRILSFSRMVAAGYLIFFVLSFARGCDANGLLAAANESRGFIGPLAAMAYFADTPVDEESLRRIVRLYLLFGAALCAAIILAATGLQVGMSALFTAPDDRLLPSSAAAVVAICGFLALARATYFAQWLPDLLWPGIFFFAAIYLRHRTVWMMLLAGTVALAFIDRRLFRWMAPTALVATFVVAGIAIYSGDKPGLASESDFAQSLSNRSTWQWRVNGWQEFLFESEQTPLTILAGKPMGDGWQRIDVETHLLQTAPPHSEYVTEYLRVGVAGLVLTLLFACGPLLALWRPHDLDNCAIYPSISIWAVIVLIVLVYGAAYSIEPEAYALIGIANAIAVSTRAREGRLDLARYGIEEASPGLAG